MSKTPIGTEAPVARLQGVGPQLTGRLAGLGITTVGELLEHMPSRYLAVREVRPVADWEPGSHGRIEVTVSSARTRRGGRVVITEANAVDADGSEVSLVWFGQRWLAKQLPGRAVVCEGVVGAGRRARMEVRSHVYSDDLSEAERSSGLRPVYPTTEKVSQARIRSLLDQALGRAEIAEPLPAALRRRFGLLSRAEAYAAVHRPAEADQARAGRRRLAFDELLAGQLVLRLIRERDARRGAPSLEEGRDHVARVIAGLPFALSPGQARLWGRLRPALEAQVPLRTLVQGEVGSGKTVIAALSLAACAGAGRLGVLLCPTELLAAQHHRSLSELLDPAAIEVRYLTGSLDAAERRTALALPDAPGRAPVLVGTHALLGALGPRARARLGMVVVDEQHRFGVAQRHALVDQAAAEGVGVHLLQLTATPIPRSLALTAFGDMQVHDLPARPEARRRVETRLITPQEVGQEVRDAAAMGAGSFIVAPRIGDEDSDDAVLSRSLRNETLAGLQVEIVHGRHPAAERAAAIARFAAGQAQVLLATTVIEVGIDVPEAGLMVVLGADAFGLAQLHQLRGRVGRAGQQARCLLVPSAGASPESLERLGALIACDDGLELARRDLALRGSGQLHGDQQAGTAGMRIARLERDARTLAEARYAARLILRSDPSFSHPAHALLRGELSGQLASLARISRG